jgi:hypothetical protein
MNHQIETRLERSAAWCGLALLVCAVYLTGCAKIRTSTSLAGLAGSACQAVQHHRGSAPAVAFETGGFRPPGGAGGCGSSAAALDLRARE